MIVPIVPADSASLRPPECGAIRLKFDGGRTPREPGHVTGANGYGGLRLVRVLPGGPDLATLFEGVHLDVEYKP